MSGIESVGMAQELPPSCANCENCSLVGWSAEDGGKEFKSQA